MTFEDACYLIRDLINTVPYKVILRYKSNQRWSFKFERGANQYDALEILYMGIHQVDKALPINLMTKKMNISLSDEIAFYNLQSGNWKHILCMKDPRYDNYRRIFTDITGIELR